MSKHPYGEGQPCWHCQQFYGRRHMVVELQGERVLGNFGRPMTRVVNAEDGSPHGCEVEAEKAKS